MELRWITVLGKVRHEVLLDVVNTEINHISSGEAAFKIGQSRLEKSVEEGGSVVVCNEASVGV